MTPTRHHPIYLGQANLVRHQSLQAPSKEAANIHAWVYTYAAEKIVVFGKSLASPGMAPRIDIVPPEHYPSQSCSIAMFTETL